MRRTIQTILAAIAVAFLVGCSTLGAQSPTDFNGRLAAGYKTVEGVANVATQLRAAGKLSDADRDNVVATSRTAIAGLDLAAQTHQTSPAAGDQKLTATIAVLTALQAYLAAKGQP